MADNSTIRQELVVVTPERATQIAEQCHYELQRSLSESHIARLADEMRRGTFMSGTQVHFAVKGKSTYCINGNHTLAAIARAGVPVLLSFLYTDCKGEGDIASLYSRHDIHRKRGWSAIFKAHGMFADVHANSQLLLAIGAAIGAITHGLDNPGQGYGEGMMSFSRDLRIRAMEEYADQVYSYVEILDDACPRSKKLMRRAGVMAVALETLRFHRNKALEFWRSVAADDGLHKGNPAKTLLNWLDNEEGAGSKWMAKIIRGCTLAWNAFYNGEQLSLIRADGIKNYELAGTAWKNGKRPPMDALAWYQKEPAPPPELRRGVGRPRKDAPIAVPAAPAATVARASHAGHASNGNGHARPRT